MDTNEMVSALVDGQLQGDAQAQALAAVCQDTQALAAWSRYHLVGDVLRSGELATARSPQAFAARLSERLAREQVVIEAANVPAPVAAEVVVATRPAANDGIFRWKLVAGLASVAAVAAVGWTVATSVGTPPASQLATSAPAAGPTVLAGTERGPMIRDPRLDELLAAHRQLGGANALQAPAGFLRNATFEGPQR